MTIHTGYFPIFEGSILVCPEISFIHFCCEVKWYFGGDFRFDERWCGGFGVITTWKIFLIIMITKIDRNSKNDYIEKLPNSLEIFPNLSHI